MQYIEVIEMLFMQYEKKILNEFERKLKKNNSIKNIIKVFTDSYLIENKKYKRNEDADMELFQYGIYDWGEGKKLEIDFVRQLIKSDCIHQIHITLKIPYEEKFSKIKEFSKWYNSYNNKSTIKDWHDEIEKLEIFQKITGMKYDLD